MLRTLRKSARRLAGQPTRGKTAGNRLRRVDRFVIDYDPDLIGRRDDSVFVDLGYGSTPVTTLESARRFRGLDSALKVIGVEIDPARVACARRFEGPGLEFRLGGFDLPLSPQEPARLIRAFNVLRQYDEPAVAEAHALMASHVIDGGLLVEGTSDPFGRVWTAWLLRKRSSGLEREALVFGTNFKSGFDPELFQAVLPKELIHRLVPGEPIHDLFQAWHRAARETISTRVFGPRQWFRASLELLAERRVGLHRRPRDWQRGWAVFEPPSSKAG